MAGTSGSAGALPVRRVVAARLVQVWGVCTVVVSGFLTLFGVVGCVRLGWEQLQAPAGAVNLGNLFVAFAGTLGSLGGLLATGWLALRGLRLLVRHVAGGPLRMWIGAGGGGFLGGGGGGHGGGHGGGDGGAGCGGGGGGCGGGC
ncbi:hypothetical protein [Streptomyces sp. HNM0574]|uniref:hypothetical protein n=1 Tax=Streptomyces sp. HNM0574 TaxID=2714954 RepID=UPI00146A0BF6|nr:hypothetical protein [Streptomyces sp. HNM0574]NLU67151.1 hypothetical protein [Streptomyces sp. HNM0574]